MIMSLTGIMEMLGRLGLGLVLAVSFMVMGACIIRGVKRFELVCGCGYILGHASRFHRSRYATSHMAG